MSKIVSRVIAFLLLAVILLIGGATVALHYRQLGYAAFVSYTQYLDPDGGAFDNISARIQSLTAAINTDLFGKDWFQRVNARLQLAVGKEVLSFGNTTMVRLRTGQLYDLMGDVDVSGEVDKMARLKTKLDAANIPMVFVYAHTELYEDNLLPVGITDDNNAVADRIVSGLREAGIETLDSREIYKQYDMTMGEAVYRTDQHWSTWLAFNAYLEAMRTLGEVSPIAPDPAALDPANFDFHIYGAAHMGDVGARVGAASVAPDDFMVVTPLYDTHITSSISSTAGYVDREGSFAEAVLNMELLEGAAPTNRYDVFGRHTEVAYYHNDGAPQGRLLIVKDSFGTPVASLASLAYSDICALDLRKGRATIEEYVASFKPDAVLIVHCQEMFRGKNYVFVD